MKRLILAACVACIALSACNKSVDTDVAVGGEANVVDMPAAVTATAVVDVPAVVTQAAL